jgi:hypothetical protein
MKRAAAIVLGMGWLLAAGCGTRSYEERLEYTLDQMRYQRRLNENLTEAPKGRLEQLLIYVRPPKDLAGPTQTFQLTVLEPGKFDLEASFIEQDRQSLHLLARVKQPRTETKKAPSPASSVPRGDFISDVIEVVRNAYGADLELARFKEESRKTNVFRHALLDLEAKEVQIYIYGNKNTSHEVALIFEYPKSERNRLNPRIALCLESFAVAERARRAFAGGETDDLAPDAAGEESGQQPVVF